MIRRPVAFLALLSAPAFAGSVLDNVGFLAGGRPALDEALKPLNVSVVTSATEDSKEFSAQVDKLVELNSGITGHREFVIGLSPKIAVISVFPRTPRLYSAIREISIQMVADMRASNICTGVCNAAGNLSRIDEYHSSSHVSWLAEQPSPVQRPGWWAITSLDIAFVAVVVVLLPWSILLNLRHQEPEPKEVATGARPILNCVRGAFRFPPSAVFHEVVHTRVKLPPEATIRAHVSSRGYLTADPSDFSKYQRRQLQEQAAAHQSAVFLGQSSAPKNYGHKYYDADSNSIIYIGPSGQRTVVPCGQSRQM